MEDLYKNFDINFCPQCGSKLQDLDCIKCNISLKSYNDIKHLYCINCSNPLNNQEARCSKCKNRNSLLLECFFEDEKLIRNEIEENIKIDSLNFFSRFKSRKFRENIISLALSNLLLKFLLLVCFNIGASQYLNIFLISLIGFALRIKLLSLKFVFIEIIFFALMYIYLIYASINYIYLLIFDKITYTGMLLTLVAWFIMHQITKKLWLLDIILKRMDEE